MKQLELKNTSWMASAFFALAFLLSPSLSGLQAQEAPEMPKPTQEHLWLKKFVGEWASEAKGMAAPGQPEMQCKGTVSSRSIGGFWIINEMKGEAMGAPMNGIQTIGYDEGKKKYVGTWVDNMNGFMWKYVGSVDEKGTTLTLEAEGPNFLGDPNTMTQFQDIYEFKSDDEMVVYSKILGPDKKWITMMTGTSKRIKK